MNRHLSEEEMVLFHFRDHEGNGELRQHVESCAECRASLARLDAVLRAVNEETLPVPLRGEEYGEQVWRQVSAKLPEAAPALPWWRRQFYQQPLVWAGAMAMIVMVAFLAGRISKDAPTDTAGAGQVRERVVLVAVGEHLEDSQMILIELVNAEGNGKVDISAERERARELLEANRIYRESAAKFGQPVVRSVLDDLERVLTEVANSPSELSADDLRMLQQQIQSQGLLFKVRVVRSRVQRKIEDQQKNDEKGSRRETRTI